MAKSKAKKIPLKTLLLEQKLATNEKEAQALIMAGQIEVHGKLVDKPGTPVSEDAPITKKENCSFVSRGGLKLAAALDAFPINVKGISAADVGASTGGFTDCLLQNGAEHVYAIDTASNELAWKLRNDQRVSVLDRQNALHLKALPEKIDLAVIDLSFTPLARSLPVVSQWLKKEGQIIALLKPQYEIEDKELPDGAVVTNSAQHREALLSAFEAAKQSSLPTQGAICSPILGRGGNKEFLLHLTPAERGCPAPHSLLEELGLS